MTISQTQLLAFLKRCEREGRSFTISDAAQACGLSEVTIRTYAAKRLGTWMSRGYGGRFSVLGILSVRDSEFEQLMSQANRVDDLDAWRSELRSVLAVGQQRGFPVADVLRGLVPRPSA